MRTNISRFTVAFSDLAWESIIEESEVPMFPQAWQVGRYLRKYAERFLPNGVLRLRQRVVRTSRRVENEEGRRWTIQWTTERFVLPIFFLLWKLDGLIRERIPQALTAVITKTQNPEENPSTKR